MRVLIENSVGTPHTSMKHARNYVKRRRAEWVRSAAVPTIRFIESDHRHVATKACAIRLGHFYEAGQCTLASERQRRGAGMVGDVDKLITIGILGVWPWTAAVIVRPTQNITNNEPPAVRTAILRARYAR
jgi:hypothetical protein